MTASSLAGHNYPGANQAVNTHTIHIPSLWKTDNVKKIFKELFQPSRPINFETVKLDWQLDKQFSHNKTVLNL